MAEVTKYQLISNNNNNNNNNIISELKGYFSVFRTTKKSSSFIYGIVLVFVFFTIFLAFSPSSPSPWFINVFAVNSTSPPISDQSHRSHHFDSVYSYFFPNSTTENNLHDNNNSSSRSQINPTFQYPFLNNSLPNSQNLNKTHVPPDKIADFQQKNSTVVNPLVQNNQSSVLAPQISPISQSFADKIAPQSSASNENTTIVDQNNVVSDHSTSLQRKSNSTEVSSNQVQQNATIIHQEQQQTNQSSEIPQQGNSTEQHNDKISGTNPPQITPSPSNSSTISTNSTKKGSGIEVKSSDFEASLSKNKDKSHANDSVSGKEVKNEVENLLGCDLYDGGWVKDDSYPLYKPGSCKLVDEQFNCLLNGRPDHDYYKLKWKPKGCNLPRLNGGHLLELLRGKRLVFVGDSLNRNMWESLVCILKNSVKNKKQVHEAFGRHSFRTEASYSFVFKDYNCTVEFFVAPFLVQQWEVKQKDGSVKETLRLDLMVRDADQFKNADFLIFNTGHWWTHFKTSKGEDYYQEGSHVYKQLDVTEAFRRAITTWARWVDANINSQRTHVMFRGYSASHFSGGQWNSGGACDSETEPIKNDTYLTRYPWKMKMFESVIKGMKLPVSYLNVTRMTDYRKDGHPSVYRKQHLSGDEKAALKYQDCSHWCLPGVPDSWNELLYAELLRKQYKDQQQKNKT